MSSASYNVVFGADNGHEVMMLKRWHPYLLYSREYKRLRKINLVINNSGFSHLSHFFKTMLSFIYLVCLEANL